MKDKLREFLKTGTRKTVMRGESGRYPNGEGWGHSWNEEVVEFNAKKLDAALIDAEGDGGVVAAWQFQSRDGTWHEFTNEKHRLATEEDGTWPIRALYTHPARSGVVSNKDVDEAMLAYNVDCHSRGDLSSARGPAMRAALESYERNRG